MVEYKIENGGFENLSHRKREPQPPKTRTSATENKNLNHRIEN